MQKIHESVIALTCHTHHLKGETINMEEQSLKTKYNYCIYHRFTGTNQAEARRSCMAEILDELIRDESVAQKQYGELADLLPDHHIKILEIKGDEATHEKELRQILMETTKKPIPINY
jgi:hypothetical protein